MHFMLLNTPVYYKTTQLWNGQELMAETQAAKELKQRGADWLNFKSLSSILSELLLAACIKIE